MKLKVRKIQTEWTVWEKIADEIYTVNGTARTAANINDKCENIFKRRKKIYRIEDKSYSNFIPTHEAIKSFFRGEFGRPI